MCVILDVMRISDHLHLRSKCANAYKEKDVEAVAVFVVSLSKLEQTMAETSWV